MRGYSKLVAQCTAISAVLAWVLSNGLDVMSVLFFVQTGGRFALRRYRPAEHWLIYVGLRTLATMAVTLFAIHISKKWPGAARASWGALTVCALATAAVAWWRIAT